MSVSVVITCFNEGPYIGPAVRSVLDQTAADQVESIIVVDDGSDEPTLAALCELPGWDRRIDVRYGPGGAGQARNRNLAAEGGRSEYLALLDGDDLWAPDKLARQLAQLKARPDVGLSYTGYYTFPGTDLGAAQPSRVRELDGAGDLACAYFLDDPPIMPSSILMRRDRFEAAGGFDPSVRVFEDTEFCLRMARVCRFAAIPEPLIYKRTRPGSITAQRSDMMANHAYVAFRAAVLQPQLLPLIPRRLAQRAAKLANVHYYAGQLTEAGRLYDLAVRLDPLAAKAWAGLLLTRLGGRRARSMLERRLAPKAASLGR